MMSEGDVSGVTFRGRIEHCENREIERVSYLPRQPGTLDMYRVRVSCLSAGLMGYCGG